MGLRAPPPTTPRQHAATHRHFVRRPVHDQPHRRIEIPFSNERRRSLSMTSRGGKGRDFLSPEACRRRFRPRRASSFKCANHVAGRIEHLTTREMRHPRDRRGGMAIPPPCEAFHRALSPCREIRFAGECRRSPGRRRTFEHSRRHRHEIFHPRIGKALPTGVVQRELAAEPENVPGVHRRATPNRAKEEVRGLAQQIEGHRDVTARHGFVCRHAAAHHARRHPRRRRRNPPRHPLSRLPTSQASKHRCQ